MLACMLLIQFHPQLRNLSNDRHLSLGWCKRYHSRRERLKTCEKYTKYECLSFEEFEIYINLGKQLHFVENDLTNHMKNNAMACVRIPFCLTISLMSGLFPVGFCRSKFLPTSSNSTLRHSGSNVMPLHDAIRFTIFSARFNLPLERSHLTDSGMIQI